MTVSETPFHVITAYDINEAANTTYRHNHPDTKVSTSSIVSIPTEALDGKALLWTMSPPCQPFTRAGAKRDNSDTRTEPFLHLLKVLEAMTQPPKFLLLENVKGFEISQSHKLMADVLSKRGYEIHQFLLTPTQFGIPNERVRYYCVAILRDASVAPAGELLTSVPGSKLSSVCPPLRQYLLETNTSAYSVPEAFLSGCAHYRFDMVTPEHCISSCFTKAYGKNYKGSGPLMLISGSHSVSDKLPSKSDKADGDDDDGVDGARPGVRTDALPRYSSYTDQKLRFFAPVEISKLMGFPQKFAFPESISTKQAYALLGNSLNVLVVSELLKFMMRHA